jgi:hypothetical protein
LLSNWKRRQRSVEYHTGPNYINKHKYNYLETSYSLYPPDYHSVHDKDYCDFHDY